MATAETVFIRTRQLDNGCWEWIGAKRRDGYGHLEIGDKMLAAHRVAYTLARGPIPDGLVIDHLCRNRLCVNPFHLEPVTIKENLHRGDTIPARNARKTYCSAGHAYTPENTYRYPNNKGRYCRTCVRASQKRYQDRLRRDS